VQTAHDYKMTEGKFGRHVVTNVKKGYVFTRPLQRLFPLEISSSEEVHTISRAKEKIHKEQVSYEEIPEAQQVQTRSGRKVVKPSRYSNWCYNLNEC